MNFEDIMSNVGDLGTIALLVVAIIGIGLGVVKLFGFLANTLQTTFPDFGGNFLVLVGTGLIIGLCLIGFSIGEITSHKIHRFDDTLVYELSRSPSGISLLAAKQAALEQTMRPSHSGVLLCGGLGLIIMSGLGFLIKSGL